MALSAALAATCLLSLALPLAQGGARLATVGLATWALGLASQAAWEYLAARLLASPSSLPALPQANILLEAAPSAEAAQAVGTVWTWSCFALATWRRVQARR